jgi:DNA invertase Pin-like site-specific DNA recombinase
MNLRRERQMEGIKAAKARGVYKGRPRSVKSEAIAPLKAEGLGATAIDGRLGINRASVYRLMGLARPIQPSRRPEGAFSIRRVRDGGSRCSEKPVRE